MTDVLYILMAVLAFVVPAALVARADGRTGVAGRAGGSR